MNKMNMTLVCIDDDVKIQEDAFFDDIEDEVAEIKFFSDPKLGLEYLRLNLDKNLVIFVQ